MTKVELIGARELLEAFNGMPRQFTEQALQKINVKVAQPLVYRMHRLAPVGLTGQLADSIGVVKSGKNNQGELGAVTVGPRRSGGYKGFAGHLIEFGTKPRYTKNRAYRGKGPADPFIEEAFDDVKGQLLDTQQNELGNLLGLYLRKTVKR